MWLTDRASQGLGMRVEKIAAGEAVISMTVTREMANGYGLCHGGYIFTLADSAFAFACNTYDERAVAQHCAVTFIRPCQPDVRLSAHAREVSRAGRSGIYDVTVRDEAGNVIAEFRGQSRTVGGTIVEARQQG